MSNATKEAPANKPVQYKMPLVELGEVVLYFEGGVKSRPQAAIVSQVDGNSVVLNILLPNSYNFKIRDGVRHMDDPRTKDSEKIENGLWDYTPFGKACRRMLTERSLAKSEPSRPGVMNEKKPINAETKP